MDDLDVLDVEASGVEVSGHAFGPARAAGLVVMICVGFALLLGIAIGIATVLWVALFGQTENLLFGLVFLGVFSS